jgi:predicted RNA-binding Zn-ribbon protein involved in translation (DUF1610 family)
MDNQHFSELVKKHNTLSGIVRELGLPLHGGNIQNVKTRIKELDLDTSHFVGRNHPRKYTKEVLEEAVSNSVSYAEVCKFLGVKWSGGMHEYLRRRVEEYGLKTTHFLGRRANSGTRHKGGTKKKTADEILQKRENGRRSLSYALRRSLIDIGRPYQCENCGIKDWDGKELVLQIHHKNGNWLDDRKDNLQFLCPNCHSQTLSWCNSKGLTEKTSVRLQSTKRRQGK